MCSWTVALLRARSRDSSVRVLRRSSRALSTVRRVELARARKVSASSVILATTPMPPPGKIRVFGWFGKGPPLAQDEVWPGARDRHPEEDEAEDEPASEAGQGGGEDGRDRQGTAPEAGPDQKGDCVGQTRQEDDP